MAPHITRFVLTALAVMGFASYAQAALVAETYGACAPGDGCDGSTLFLSIDDDGGSGDWIVTYTINTDGYDDGRAGINQIGFKAIQGWDTNLSVVLSSPTDPLPDWNPIVEAATNSGAGSPCNPLQGNKNDKVCVSGFVGITGDGEYTWTFKIVGGTVMADTSDWHLGGQYANGGGRATGKIWSTDGGGTPVPEPTAALLFGLGAILVARRVPRS
jgi:hypothetical protein